MKIANSGTVRLAYYFLLVGLALPWIPAFAYVGDSQMMQINPSDSTSTKFLSAAIAFGTAVIAAGWAIGQAGSAGLAGTAERPEIRTTAIIITALGEALAIYGIVIAIMLLGQAT